MEANPSRVPKDQARRGEGQGSPGYQAIPTNLPKHQIRLRQSHLAQKHDKEGLIIIIKLLIYGKNNTFRKFIIKSNLKK